MFTDGSFMTSEVITVHYETLKRLNASWINSNKQQYNYAIGKNWIIHFHFEAKDVIKYLQMYITEMKLNIEMVINIVKH